MYRDDEVSGKTAPRLRLSSNRDVKGLEGKGRAC